MTISKARGKNNSFPIAKYVCPISQLYIHYKKLVISYGYGSLQNGQRRGQVLPLQKGGSGKGFSHIEGGRGSTKCFDEV